MVSVFSLILPIFGKRVLKIVSVMHVLLDDKLIDCVSENIHDLSRYFTENLRKPLGVEKVISDIFILAFDFRQGNLSRKLLF